MSRHAPGQRAAFEHLSSREWEQSPTHASYTEAALDAGAGAGAAREGTAGGGAGNRGSLERAAAASFVVTGSGLVVTAGFGSSR